ncbi:hypothetical protein [Amphritea balenae]|uniref:Uncharacterized protein n=1 Tax=Amphritea balenae TaxID=452629 RepID=A0A3P1SKF1_9GAMM|nr:hypothetical protein [Amphritea balenae]RRC97566.1 hypothetical protein EHS89_17180 [Amphritea balenae]GGK74050.1 hypothetical protein GCM10007941_25140 [Amphritea balenae]
MQIISGWLFFIYEKQRINPGIIHADAPVQIITARLFLIYKEQGEGDPGIIHTDAPVQIIIGRLFLIYEE